MEEKTINLLRKLADKYETKNFIAFDPIQIPHRYTDKRDIEISAFVTAWISWGNRTSIIRTADFIDRNIFKCKPYEFIMNLRNFEDFQNDSRKIYRTFAYSDFYDLCHVLHGIYSMDDNMENYTEYTSEFPHPMFALSDYFFGVKGIPFYENKSSCKRLNMFLRWVCRKDSPVDFGIWDFDPKDLIVPIDIHVLRTARKLGLTKKNNPTFNVAAEITEEMKEAFSNDPCRGDFALFGAGIDKEVRL